jgi:hypothetical protein
MGSPVSIFGVTRKDNDSASTDAHTVTDAIMTPLDWPVTPSRVRQDIVGFQQTVSFTCDAFADRSYMESIETADIMPFLLP